MKSHLIIKVRQIMSKKYKNYTVSRVEILYKVHTTHQNASAISHY